MLLSLCVEIMYARGGDGVRRSLVHDPRRVITRLTFAACRGNIAGAVRIAPTAEIIFSPLLHRECKRVREVDR